MATTLPYEDHKISTRRLAKQLVNCHGSAFSPLMQADGYLEGVIAYGPPGIGKTQSVLAAAREIAAANGMDLVIYKPGVKRDPNAKRPQCLFMHMSMAGATAGRIAGFPTVPQGVEQKEGQAPSSRQVIPTNWRTAMEFDNVIYLFDEITHAVSQEALLSLLSEGFYEETKMAKNALFIATANEGVADGSLQQKLSTAFRNRFTAYYIRPNVAEWRQDFANGVVHPAVLAYARVYSDRFEQFKVPENNLLNAPTLRGLTLLSEDLRYFEAHNFRARTAEGLHDPKGEFLKGVEFTTDHFEILSSLAYGRLGDTIATNDFVNMYSIAYKTVIPEIQGAVAKGQLSDTFKRTLESIDGASSDSGGENALLKNASKKSASKDLKEQQNNLAIAFTFVDYAPRIFLENMENLPNHPKIRTHVNDERQKKGQPALKSDEPIPAETLKGYGASLMDNFLKAIMAAPINLRILAVRNLMDLARLPDAHERFKAYYSEQERKSLSPNTPAIPATLVLSVLTSKFQDPEYKRLREACDAGTQAKSQLESLGRD